MKARARRFPLVTVVTTLLVMTGAFVVLYVAGCVVIEPEMRSIADRIRESDSPLIDAVVFDAGDWLDDAYVAVYLNAGTSREDAARFWCEVVVPAGGTGQSQDENRAVSVWDAETDDLLVPRDGVPCQ